MRTTFELRKLDAPTEGSVVTVGVFDGVHLGHVEILRSTVERARELGASPTVVTFRRHPKRVLLGQAPRTLTTLEHRLELFAEHGIEHAVALSFDEDLRSLDAADFLQRYLVDGLAARSLVLGFDSKLGRDREGTPERLRELGMDVEVVPEVLINRRAVSSTAIREAVELGDLEGAERMLGRPVAVFGRVVHGDSRGRELGFPTANLDLHHELHPPVGVYACRVHHRVEGGGEEATERRSYAGVANIGFRPTLAGSPPAEPRVEVHLLDYQGDLYGERLEVAFVTRLRGEVRFASPAELAEQISRDIERARGLLGC